MTLRKTLLPALFLTLLLGSLPGASSAWADGPPATAMPQELRKEIEIAPASEGEPSGPRLVAVDLDGEVYRRAAGDLSDLRVLTEDGTPAPFLVRPRRTLEERRVRRAWSAATLSGGPAGEDRFELRVSLAEDAPPPTHLRVVNELVDFEQQVDLLAVGEPGSAPKPLLTGVVVFDYSAVVDVRRDTIELPETEAREFILAFRPTTDEVESPWVSLTRNALGSVEVSRSEQTRIRRRPFRIDRIEWIREELVRERREPAEVEWPVERVGEVMEESEPAVTRIEVGTGRRPIAALVIETASTNFSRRVVVELPDDRAGRPDWQRVGEDLLHRFSFQGIEEEDLEARFPTTRVESLRLGIENRDSPPLEIDAITARGPIDELVFLAEAGRAYSLIYGAEVDPPRHDLAAIERAIGTGADPVPATLRFEVRRPDAGPSPAALSRRISNFLNNALAMGGVVLVLVFVLGRSLYSAGRRVGGEEN